MKNKNLSNMDIPTTMTDSRSAGLNPTGWPNASVVVETRNQAPAAMDMAIPAGHPDANGKTMLNTLVTRNAMASTNAQ